MRLRRTIALALHLTAAVAAVAAVTLVPAGPAEAAEAAGAARAVGAAAVDAGHAPGAGRADRTCQGDAGGREFPIASRIHGEPPAVYRAGDRYRHWSLDLTDTTGSGCGALHPVLVLVDRRRELRSAQIRLEFSDGTRWRPVRFERTGQGDHVGVFGDGSPGFSVGPRETVTVRVRLAFTPGTRPDRVVATAALVQRRGDDGDWVGESGDYPFHILADGGGGGRDDGYGDGAGEVDGPGLAHAGQLAETGPRGALPGMGATSGALLLCGGALVVGARRLRVR